MTEPLSRAISAYEHCARICLEEAERYSPEGACRGVLSVLAARFQSCADALKPKDLSAAIKEAVTDE